MKNKSYEELVEEKANEKFSLKERDIKQIHGALHIAKSVIDNMHEKEREVHDIGQMEIRNIINQIRVKFAELEKENGWYEVSFTEKEIMAIGEGLVELKVRKDELTKDQQQIFNLFM